MVRPFFSGLATVIMLSFSTAVIPSALHGQQQEVPAVLPEETLTSYARAFNEISDVRDGLQTELASNSNKAAEAQQQIRERMAEEVAGILERHGLSQEQYAEITWRISTDQDQRDAFHRVLERLAESDAGDTDGAR